MTSPSRKDSSGSAGPAHTPIEEAPSAVPLSVLDIPPEILQVVFAFWIENYKETLGLRSLEAPTFLCQICSRWRRIALSTPELWTSIHIVVPNGPTFGATYMERLTGVSRWLELSAPLPLQISLHPKSMGHKPLPANFTPFLLHLVSHRKRWRSVELHVPPHELNAFMNISDGNSLTLLEFLSVGNFTFPRSKESPTTLDGAATRSMAFLSSCPRLKEFDYTLHYGCTYIPPFAGAQLTRLTMDLRQSVLNLEAPTLLSILCSCPMLESFTMLHPLFPIRPQPRASATHSDTQVVTLNHLRHFSYTSDSTVFTLSHSFFNDIFQSLIVPNLTELELSVGRAYVLPSLAQFVQPGVSLTKLSLAMTSMSLSITKDPAISTQLREILMHTPDLTELCIRTSGRVTSPSAGDFARALSSVFERTDTDATIKPIFPLLQKLILVDCFTPASLADSTDVVMKLVSLLGGLELRFSSLVGMDGDWEAIKEQFLSLRGNDDDVPQLEVVTSGQTFSTLLISSKSDS